MIEFQNISKSFGSNKALDQVTLKVKAGSIHAFIGENGAGKSTACKLLYGMHPFESGKLLYNGKPFAFKNSVQARAAGFGMVHQHFMLASEVEAWKHLWLEITANKKLECLVSPVFSKKIIEQLEALAHQYNYSIPWTKKIKDLDVATQQKIEILKMFSQKPKVIMFDEPTAILSPQDAERLLKQIQTLRDTGHTIILVTHKLKEVFAIADTVSVFRAGRCVGTQAVTQCTPDSLTEMMIGEVIQPLSRGGRKLASDPAVLKILDYSANSLHKISLETKKFEIVGIAGIEGNGQKELVEAIIKPWKFIGKRRGQITFKEKSLFDVNSAQIRKLGIAYIPEDRTKDAALPQFSALENFLLGHQDRKSFLSGLFIKWDEVRALFKKTTRELNLRPKYSFHIFSAFSGGNQQKIIVSRELMNEPDFLLAVNPTRGVDLQTTQQIHRKILDLKQNGSSVLLVSSDLDELISLCDRILVLYSGRIVGQLHHYDFNEKIIGKLMITGAE